MVQISPHVTIYLDSIIRDARQFANIGVANDKNWSRGVQPPVFKFVFVMFMELVERSAGSSLLCPARIRGGRGRVRGGFFWTFP